jgi:hypothetical protein
VQKQQIGFVLKNLAGKIGLATKLLIGGWIALLFGQTNFPALFVIGNSP